MNSSIYQDLLNFIKKPKLMRTVAPLTASNFFLLLMITFGLVIPYAFLLEFMGVGEFDNIIQELMRDHKALVLVMVIVFAPLLEETIFRYHLTLQKKAIMWSLIASVFMLSQLWIIGAGLMLYLLVLFILALRKNPPPLHIAVYISAFFFGIVHLGNYRDFDFLSNFYWIPFLVLIQFGLGLLLSFIRLHYGLLKAMLFHAVYNAVLVVPAVFLEFD
ncbi:CPBP family glutamic-type intramembrane protease [Anditalea andensis]|uniref:CAAX prenyl protease 2/Lysostaphin resistance protein A-like domain-containing protein n=1 Tax=Anditalea andensis TaxID=1048983 RepID=A0A074KWN4_9BACT|nr:CPBP family glutamic-type intramembrane protease [Anditalea andensis]KEO72013.1 hypothetical protein EL17_19030 [Anditalea andensis]